MKINFSYSQNDQSAPTLMQLNFKMQSFRLEAIIIKKLSQKVRMPVTEHNSTVKIAFLMRKYCKKIQFVIVKIVKIKRQN